MIFAVAINVISIAVMSIAIAAFRDTPVLVHIIGIAALAFQIAGHVWALVGVWRSAFRYQGAKIWKYLAFIASGLGVLISIGRFAQTLEPIFSV